MSFSPEWLLTNLAADFLLPPLNGIVLVAAGWLLFRARPPLARTLLGVGLVLLWVQALPATGHFLLGLLEGEPISLAQTADAQAIVVLGGGRYRMAPEYGGDTVGTASLARVRYAAKLHRETRLPILVSGGKPEGAGLSEAETMRSTLADEFGVPVRWVEADSINTSENARASARLLNSAGIDKILLVTDASHMPRAQGAFEAAGLTVLPAPTLFHRRPLTPVDYLPRSYGMARIAIHEWVGRLWYRLRH